VRHLHEARLRGLVERLRAVAPRVTLLAEKVESVEMYQLCRELGFDLFQGYFFARPEVLRRSARPTSSQGALVLMMAVQNPDITIDELADIATGDPTLAYRLLTLVNSSSIGLGRVVESVRHAIVLLGIEHVRHLAILLTMASNARTNPELITLAVTRAHMARSLSSDVQEGNSAFTMGLLSVIDVVFQTPMAELVDDLPLAVDVRDALLHRHGPLGMLLEVVLAYEQADTLTLESLRPGEADAIREAFGDSTAAAADLRNQLESLTTVR
jgi:EAL and modified HD-GYP domain-containing signal transduction protein